MFNRKIIFHFGSGVALVAALWLVRYCYTGSPVYFFLLWNLFLAFIPYGISQYTLQRCSVPLTKPFQLWKVGLLFTLWLLFFPNAPYVITDLIHLSERHGVPKWYDVSLLFCAGTTGLWIGFISLLQMEAVWRQKMPAIHINFFVGCTLLLSGFGIYLGRVLRFNSWDVVANPLSLSSAIGHRVLLPWQYLQTWGITLLFAALLWIGYRQAKLFLHPVTF